jgi:transcriptional regulator with XRE-family HTH domain
VSKQKLPNYLKRARKRLGLSQKEVAYLLGCASSTRVSRHERFHREPSLRTVLAYEVLYGLPVVDLFAGVTDDVERAVHRRVRRLVRRLARRGETPLVVQKLTALRAMTATGPVEKVRYEPIDSR